MKKIIFALGMMVMLANVSIGQVNKKDTMMHHKSYDSDTSRKKMNKSKNMNNDQRNRTRDTTMNGMGK